MEIKLTRAQWAALKPLVRQGDRAERALGLPVEIDNGDQKIKITSDEVVLTLENDDH